MSVSKDPAAIRAMFGRLARRYDLMNRLMTLGRDQLWRRYLVGQARLQPGGRPLDVGTGTGDIPLEALRQQPDLAQVVGADFTPAMLDIARARPGAERVGWVQADALHLPFADASFDAVTSGYLLRNVADPERALREQVRVTRPGGRVICLDTSPPSSGLLRPLTLLHLRVIIPWLGGLVAGNRADYIYLPASTEDFKTPDELAALMLRVGLVDVRYRRFMLDTMAVHTGTRPPL